MSYENNSKQEIKELTKKINFWSIIDVFPTVAFGLGLGAKFSGDSEFLHPIFNNDSVVNALLGVGAAGIVICLLKLMPLILKRAKLMKNQ